MLLERRDDGEQHVRGRAHVEADALVGQPLRQAGLLDRADAVLDAVGAEQVEGGRRRCGARRARRRGAWTAGRRRGRCRRPRRSGPGDPSSSSLARPNDDDPLAGVALGDVGLGDGIGGVDGAVGRDHPADLDTGALGRGAARRRGCSSMQLLGRTEALAVVGQVDRRLDVHRAGGHGVVGRLVDQAHHVGGPLQHVARRHVHRGEDREAAEAADDRHLHPVLVRRARPGSPAASRPRGGCGGGPWGGSSGRSRARLAEQGSAPRIGGDDGGQSGQTGEPVPRPGAYRARTTFSMLEMIP